MSMCLACGKLFMMGSIAMKPIPLGLKEAWADPSVEGDPGAFGYAGKDFRANITSTAAHTPNTCTHCTGSAVHL